MSTISVADLEPEKVALYEQTFRRILASEAAVETFAQIIDGLPTRPVSIKYTGHCFRSDLVDRLEPCVRSVHEFKQLVEKTSFGTMRVRAEAAQAYQNAEIGSREFILRLLALVSVSLHDLAVGIFSKFHPPGGPHHPEKQASFDGTFTPDFFHPSYRYWRQYPHGPADMVGYWAEAEIFGGTILFEHDELGLELRSAFFHPPGQHYQFQLSAAQLQQFTALGEPSNAETSTSDVLPFKQEPHAYAVLDDMETYPNIYRDKYKSMPKIRIQSSCVVFGDLEPEETEYMEEHGNM